jgi:hypothetical protein
MIERVSALLYMPSSGQAVAIDVPSRKTPDFGAFDR